MKIFDFGDIHVMENKQNYVYCPVLAFNYSFDRELGVLTGSMTVLWGHGECISVLKTSPVSCFLKLENHVLKERCR